MLHYPTDGQVNDAANHAADDPVPNLTEPLPFLRAIFEQPRKSTADGIGRPGPRGFKRLGGFYRPGIPLALDADQGGGKLITEAPLILGGVQFGLQIELFFLRRGCVAGKLQARWSSGFGHRLIPQVIPTAGGKQ
ncbi:MAG: hypothetical protein ABSE16_13410, partial [Verrucomicrobiota bacterium]